MTSHVLTNGQTEIWPSYVYVDKTEHIAALAKGSVYNFLSRPRRYGKSLLHSTLYHLFRGDRHLFEGLWIGEANRWDWSQSYPVIRVDFNAVEKPSPSEQGSGPLSEALIRYMRAEGQRLK